MILVCAGFKFVLLVFIMILICVEMFICFLSVLRVTARTTYDVVRISYRNSDPASTDPSPGKIDSVFSPHDGVVWYFVTKFRAAR